MENYDLMGLYSVNYCSSLIFNGIQWDFIVIQWDVNGMLMGYTRRGKQPQKTNWKDPP